MTDQLLNRFPAAGAEQWQARIAAELKGTDPASLIGETADGIPIQPFYTAEDLAPYRLDIPPRKHKGWLTAERIRVDDVGQANTAALDALQQGAMCIYFDLQRRPADEQTARQLTSGILLDIAPVYFENYSANDRAALETAVPRSCPPAVSVPQLERRSDELTIAVAKAMQLPGDTVTVHFRTGSDYFLEIAKLRAFRWLWAKINAIQESHKTAMIVSETGIQFRSEEDENKNILRNTTEAMSAVLGGCDALIINPHNHREDSAFGKRIARNIQHILQYESGLQDAEDPGRGAYYIEYLTYALSNKVWEKLQNA